MAALASLPAEHIGTLIALASLAVVGALWGAGRVVLRMEG